MFSGILDMLQILLQVQTKTGSNQVRIKKARIIHLLYPQLFRFKHLFQNMRRFRVSPLNKPLYIGHIKLGLSLLRILFRMEVLEF